MNTRFDLSRMSLRSAGTAIAAVTFVLSILAGAYASASAETLPSGALIERPAKTELTLLPGQSKTIMLTLENGTPAPLLVDVSFEDVAATAQSSSLDDPIKLLGK